jgi:DNA-directed RNA polymerase specialized sigma24 family protein
MDQVEAADPKLLAHYEGLVRTTSNRYVGKVRMDFDDICQVFRVKIWKALLAWDPAEPRIRRKIAEGKFTEDELRDRFVFMCVLNQGKDLTKRRKPENDPLFIEDFATHKNLAHGRTDFAEGNESHWFEARYLAVDDEDIFGGQDDPIASAEEVADLNLDERRVLVCMYLQYTQPEIALRLGMSVKKVAACVKSIRAKLKEWDPRPSEPELAQAA